MEARLPNFWEQEGSSGCPAAPLPFLEFAVDAGAAALRHQRGGLYGWPICLSTPENDKTDKKRNAAFATENSQPRRAFFAPASGPADVGSGEKSARAAPTIPPVPVRKLAAIGFDQVPAASA